MLNNILDLNTITLNSALVIGGFTLLCVATLGYTSYSLINYFSAPAPEANNIASEDVGIQAIKQQVDAAVQTTVLTEDIGVQGTSSLEDVVAAYAEVINSQVEAAAASAATATLAGAQVDVGVQTSKQFLGTMSEDWFTDESDGLPSRLIEAPGDFLYDDMNYVNNVQSQSLAVPTNTASLNASGASQVEAGVQATPSFSRNVDAMVQATPSIENVGIQSIMLKFDDAIQTTERIGTALKNVESASARLDVGVQTSKRLLERMITDIYLDGWSTDPSVPWTQEMLDEPAVAEAPNILLEDKSQVKNWLSKSLEVPTNTSFSSSGTSQLSPLSEPLTPTSKVAALDKELELLREIRNSLDVPGDVINLTDPIILHHNKYLEIKALYSKELYEECISNTELLGIIQTFDLCDLNSPDFNKIVLEIIQLYNS